MDLNVLERDTTISPGTCNPDYVFYHCHVLGTNMMFNGCCSIDPCSNVGIGCPIQNQQPNTSLIEGTAAPSSTTDSGTATLPTNLPTTTIVVVVPSTTTEEVTSGTSTSTTVETVEASATIPSIVIIPSSSSPSSSTPSSSSTSTIQPATSSPVLNHVASMSASSSSQSPTQTAPPAIVTSKPNHTPLIAGVVVAVAVLSILSVLAWFCFRKRQQKKKDLENARDSIAKYGLPTRDYILGRAQTDEESMRSENSDIFAQFGGRYTTPKLSHSATMPNQEHGQVLAATRIRSRSVESVVDSPTTENAPLPDFEKSTLTSPPVHEHPAYHPLPGDNDSSKVPTYQPKGQPIHSPSSSMTQHPAYHVSQLNQHPAFRSSSGPSSSRKEAYMRRSAGSMLSEIPVPFSPAFSSPLPGWCELPAEVPVSYRTPTPIEIPGSHPSPNANPAGTNRDISKENTQASTYSTPIGLGVTREGDSNVPPVPHFKVHYPEADSNDYQIKISDTPRSNSTSKQKQIQSYDGAYDEVDLSPVGNGRWSGSTMKEGMGRLDVAVDKREVDELTPLSQVYRESWCERESWCQR